MTPCPSCDRPLRAPGACPFCGATAGQAPGQVPGLTARVLRTAGAILTPIVLAACYGPPPAKPAADADLNPVPTGQADPAVPANPTGQADPAAPVNPTGQADPAAPTGQADPTTPTGQADPATPTGQADPSAPAPAAGSGTRP